MEPINIEGLADAIQDVLDQIVDRDPNEEDPWLVRAKGVLEGLKTAVHGVCGGTYDIDQPPPPPPPESLQP